MERVSLINQKISESTHLASFTANYGSSKKRFTNWYSPSLLSLTCPITMGIFQSLLISIIQSLTVSCLAIDAPSNTLLAPYNITYNNMYKTTLNSTQNLNLTDREIECKEASPPLTGSLDIASCKYAAKTSCRKLTTTAFSRLPKDQWIWVELSPFQNCALAYWVPSDAYPDLIPSRQECMDQVFEPMMEMCGRRPRLNVATINVDRLPDDYGPGTEHSEGFPSYIAAPEPLGR